MSVSLGGALLAPQAATSAAQSAVEGADEAALESALCTLRQLKGRVLRLRDEALRAQQVQRTSERQQQGPGGSAAEQQQSTGVQLRRDLLGLTAAIRQQAGIVPVILA